MLTTSRLLLDNPHQGGGNPFQPARTVRAQHHGLLEDFHNSFFPGWTYLRPLINPAEMTHVDFLGEIRWMPYMCQLEVFVD